MLLRHAREPIDGQPVENTFVAIDEVSGNELGSCVIYCDDNPSLYPARPFQVRLQLEGTDLPDKLLGASVARAREICAKSGKFARVYTRCDPDDTQMLDALMPMGFRDNDGLVKMQLRLPCAADYRLPPGCVIVRDDLSDPMEQKYFLERYNELYNTAHDFEWLQSFISRKGFMRILTVSPTGMAGEILIWNEDYCGVIGYIQTAKRWRRMGVGSCMLGLACEEFEKNPLVVAEGNVRARIPHVLRMMEKMGFSQAELLMRLPGRGCQSRHLMCTQERASRSFLDDFAAIRSGSRRSVCLHRIIGGIASFVPSVGSKQIEHVQLFGTGCAPMPAQIIEVLMAQIIHRDRAARDQRATAVTAGPCIYPVACPALDRLKLTAAAIGVEHERRVGERKQQSASCDGMCRGEHRFRVFKAKSRGSIRCDHGCDLI